jgi:hypothetical protein
MQTLGARQHLASFRPHPAIGELSHGPPGMTQICCPDRRNSMTRDQSSADSRQIAQGRQEYRRQEVAVAPRLPTCVASLGETPEL